MISGWLYNTQNTAQDGNIITIEIVISSDGVLEPSPCGTLIIELENDNTVKYSSYKYNK